MRDAVADSLRRRLPNARIIHELVCGQRRADLAAVEPERLTLIELKSEKDKLDRCEGQMDTFRECGHHAILVAHQKWFDSKPYTDGSARFVWPGSNVGYSVWAYPEPPLNTERSWYIWKLDERERLQITQPYARAFLGLLWRIELEVECCRHGINAGPRSNMKWMIDQMAYRMTGKEIARAVCRQLRLRPFPEADPPIREDDCLKAVSAEQESNGGKHNAD